MAHLGREPCVAIDAVLERGGHVVERTSQAVDVRIGAGGQSGVEASAGDGISSATDIEQRAHDAARRPETEQATGELVTKMRQHVDALKR